MTVDEKKARVTLVSLQRAMIQSKKVIGRRTSHPKRHGRVRNFKELPNTPVAINVYNTTEAK